MPNTPKTNMTPRQAKQIDGLLIAEFSQSYRPISPVSSLREAKEIAEGYIRRNPSPLPIGYCVWTRNFDGEYVISERLEIA